MKNKRINIKVTEDELEVIKLSAKTMHMTVSGLLLYLVMNFAKCVKK